MGWFDENGFSGYTPYEAGGYTGGTAQRPQVDPTTVEQPPQDGAPPAAPTPPQGATPPLADAPGGVPPGSTPTWTPGAHAGQNVTLLGYDSGKLNDPSYSTGKYNSAVQAFYNGLKQDVGLSRGGLGNMIAYLQANGFKGAKAVGDDKIDFGDGAGPIDVVRSDGQIVFQDPRGVDPNAGRQAAPVGGDGAAMPTGNLAAGYGFGGGGGGSHGLNLGSFDPYTYEAFKAPDPFQAPTIDDARNDPGYAFGLDQGSRLLQNSAAAKGMLRTGNTLKALNQFGNDYATTKYGDVYNRRLGEYQQNYNQAFQTNQANNQGRLAGFNANTNAALGYGNLDLGYTRAGNDYSLGLGNLALGNKQADQGYDLGLRNNALGYLNANNSFTLGQQNNQLGWANYGLGAQQQQFFQNYQWPTSVGFGAAGQLGSFGSQYGAQSGNNATGAGNANASGIVGGANAWNGALGNIGNTAVGLYYGSQYGRR